MRQWTQTKPGREGRVSKFREDAVGRSGSAHLLQNLAAAAAGRALSRADLACAVALAAHVLGHSGRSRLTLIARIQLGSVLLDRGRWVRAARIVAHCAVPPLRDPALMRAELSALESAPNERAPRRALPAPTPTGWRSCIKSDKGLRLTSREAVCHLCASEVAAARTIGKSSPPRSLARSSSRERTMKRRQFLQTASAGLAAGAVAMPAVAQSMPEVKWRLTSGFPKSLDTIYGGAELFARYVSEATDGRFQVQPFAAGEIVGTFQALDAVGNATVEMAHTASYYYVGKDPTFAFGTAAPFGLNARQLNAWMYYGGGMDIMNQFYEKSSLYMLP